MNYRSFYEFEEYYSIPYSEKKYDEVLNLLHHANELLPKDEYEKSLFELMIYEAMIYTQTNNSVGCLTVIKKSLEKGYSLPLHWSSFNFLKEHPEYEALSNLNRKHLQQAKENSKFKYEVHLPKAYDKEKKHPLFFCLHGDGFGCNIKNTSWYWKADELLEKGYIVVYAQSSQIYFHNSFGWLSDPALSRKELKDCYEQLLLDYSIDETCVLIGGFSGGATTSIDIAFHNAIPVKGVIALCPGDYLGNIELKDTRKLAERKTKIVILEGDQDTDPVVQHILKLFKEGGLAHEYYINKGIGHKYPKDLAEKTLKAEEFIVSN
jgi:predicted esterase